jgi:ribose 5-phosphate isomerase
MLKGGGGGVFRSLTFADDLIIVAKSEREVKEMMEKKKLEVNVEKTRMMAFSKRKSEENEWN